MNRNKIEKIISTIEFMKEPEKYIQFFRKHFGKNPRYLILTDSYNLRTEEGCTVMLFKFGDLE